jgi:AraC-like DNA-binding protein
MKPVFQKLTNSPDEGFACKVIRGRSFDCPWHFHEEFELILVIQSGGYRMLADHLAPLRPGDLVLVGPSLPHLYQNDEGSQGRAPRIHAVLIQFEENCLGGELMRLPALAPVRRLFRRADLGLHFTGATCDRVARLMQEIAGMDGLRRIIQFLSILEALAWSVEARTLASRGFVTERNPFDQERMNRVCQFIHERLDQPIFLPELARLAHLSEGAFSRFFHSHTGKTFPEFINELRVGRACRLLAEDDLNMTEVAFACGFSNLSNFNRQFKRIKQTTPREFGKSVKEGLQQSGRNVGM